MHWLIFSLFLVLLAGLAESQFQSQLPFLIKSSYLHLWINPNEISASVGASPVMWNNNNLGWTSRIQVDGVMYEWIGTHSRTRPNMTNNEVTATRTIFSFTAGPIAFNATYLSPIDPSDLVSQSLPFGYVYIDVWSLDGNSHSVQLFIAISGQILSNIDTDKVQSNAAHIGDVFYQEMSLANKQTMTEIDGVAKDSTLILAMQNRPDMSWQAGTELVELNAWNNLNTPLLNTSNSILQSIHDTSKIAGGYPVLASEVNLGNITHTEDPVVWAVGLVRDPVVNYTLSGNSQNRRPYYFSAYNTMDSVFQGVVSNFNDVKSKSIDLDNKILMDGGAISTNYTDLLSFSLRMAFGPMDITLPNIINGSTDMSDTRIFMKDIGSSSSATRVNAVEVIYASFPAILYLNSTLAGPLLEPLLEYQNSSDYKNLYAAPDLGSNYPSVQGNPSDTSELALESCGSMLIMTLAHALKSGDGSLLYRYYNLLRVWADYLDKNTLYPAAYTNADGERNLNSTNLVLKGILGLYAMGKISNITGNSTDASHYQSQAQNYFNQWETFSISSNHITSVYGDTSDWGLIYNLYAAKLIGAGIISDQIYTQQSQFYGSQLAAAPKFGFPYDTNDAGKAKSHWSLFTAATVMDSSIRDSLIGMVWNRLTFNDTAFFPTTYSPVTGSSITGVASPAQGAMFAPLALNIANQEISVPSLTPIQVSRFGKHNKVNIGAIVGGVVAGVIVILSLLILACYIIRRRRTTKERRFSSDKEVEPFTPALFQKIVNNTTMALHFVSPPKGKSNNFTHPSAHAANSSIALSLSTAGAASSSFSPALDMRTEMEELQREMSALRNERLQDLEPPPLYDLTSGGAGVLSNSGRGAINITTETSGLLPISSTGAVKHGLQDN